MSPNTRGRKKKEKAKENKKQIFLTHRKLN